MRLRELEQALPACNAHSPRETGKVLAQLLDVHAALEFERCPQQADLLSLATRLLDHLTRNGLVGAKEVMGVVEEIVNQVRKTLDEHQASAASAPPPYDPFAPPPQSPPPASTQAFPPGYPQPPPSYPQGHPAGHGFPAQPAAAQPAQRAPQSPGFAPPPPGAPPGPDGQPLRLAGQPAGNGEAPAPNLQLVNNRKLGEILISMSMLTRADVDRALKMQRMTGKRFGEVLISMNLLSKDMVESALRMQRQRRGTGAHDNWNIGK